MRRSLFRLVAMTFLMATAAIALGFTTYYLLEPSPYRQVATIDPRVAPPDLLQDLRMNRIVPARFGPHNIVGSNTIERVDVDDRVFGSVSTSELVTRFFVHSRTTYSSSPVIVPLTIELRRFPDPLQARIALLEMMVREQGVRSVSNPIKGHIYSSHGWPVVYRWVDGVWLGRLEAYNRDFMSLLVSWVPYVEMDSNSAEFTPDRPHVPSQPFLLPALFLVAAAGVWPIAASRVLKVRPRRNLKRLHVDGLIANLDALNEESRNWKITGREPRTLSPNGELQIEAGRVCSDGPACPGRSRSGYDCKHLRRQSKLSSSGTWWLSRENGAPMQSYQSAGVDRSP